MGRGSGSPRLRRAARRGAAAVGHRPRPSRRRALPHRLRAGLHASRPARPLDDRPRAHRAAPLAAGRPGHAAAAGDRGAAGRRRRGVRRRRARRAGAAPRRPADAGGRRPRLRPAARLPRQPRHRAVGAVDRCAERRDARRLRRRASPSIAAASPGRPRRRGRPRWRSPSASSPPRSAAAPRVRVAAGARALVRRRAVDLPPAAVALVALAGARRSRCRQFLPRFSAAATDTRPSESEHREEHRERLGDRGICDLGGRAGRAAVRRGVHARLGAGPAADAGGLLPVAGRAAGDVGAAAGAAPRRRADARLPVPRLRPRAAAGRPPAAVDRVAQRRPAVPRRLPGGGVLAADLDRPARAAAAGDGRDRAPAAARRRRRPVRLRPRARPVARRRLRRRHRLPAQPVQRDLARAPAGRRAALAAVDAARGDARRRGPPLRPGRPGAGHRAGAARRPPAHRALLRRLRRGLGHRRRRVDRGSRAARAADGGGRRRPGPRRRRRRDPGPAVRRVPVPEPRLRLAPVHRPEPAGGAGLDADHRARAALPGRALRGHLRRRPQLPRADDVRRDPGADPGVVGSASAWRRRGATGARSSSPRPACSRRWRSTARPASCTSSRRCRWSRARR